MTAQLAEGTVSDEEIDVIGDMSGMMEVGQDTNVVELTVAGIIEVGVSDIAELGLEIGVIVSEAMFDVAIVGELFESIEIELTGSGGDITGVGESLFMTEVSEF